jgi:GntR family transcriptional regulator/MocR family aminotransferase
LHEAARRELGGLLNVVRSESGLHTIGHLPAHLSEIAVARAAAERGIVVSPVARFSIEPSGVNGLVLGFGGVRPAEIRNGIAELSMALRQRGSVKSSPVRTLQSDARPARRPRIGMAKR